MSTRVGKLGHTSHFVPVFNDLLRRSVYKRVSNDTIMILYFLYPIEHRITSNVCSFSALWRRVGAERSPNSYSARNKGAEDDTRRWDDADDKEENRNFGEIEETRFDIGILRRTKDRDEEK